MKPTPLLALLLTSVAFAAPEPKFRLQEIDKVEIGYGLAIADVDGLGTFSYQWAADGRNISGATSSTFVLTQDQVGKPIYISEYDIGDTNDQVQLQNFQAHFPVFWDHPHVKGITIWGYVNGRTWIEGSGLISENGTPRPAMTWLLNNYIRK